VALSERDVDLVVQVPIIPGQTDDEADWPVVAHFLSGLSGLPRLELLPYNVMAQAQ
jgi:pyruvate-formate lyase-activating enzyme